MHEDSGQFWRPKKISNPDSTDKRSMMHRLLDFIEHPLSLCSVGTVTALVGFFVYRPVLFICGGLILLAFHRARVVSGKSWKIQLISFIFLAAITFAGIYEIEITIDKHLPDLPKEVADRVIKALSGKDKTNSNLQPTEKNIIQSQNPVPEAHSNIAGRHKKQLRFVNRPSMPSAVADEGLINVLSADYTLAPDEQLITVRIVLQNFGKAPVQADVTGMGTAENAIDKTQTLYPTEPSTLALAPQQTGTYLFRFKTSNRTDYDNVINGMFILKFDLRAKYRPIATETLTKVFVLRAKLNIPNKDVDIEFSGWE